MLLQLVAVTALTYILASLGALNFSQFSILNIAYVLIIILFVFFAGKYFIAGLVSPYSRLKDYLALLANGNLPVFKSEKSKINNADLDTELIKLSETLSDYAHLIENIGNKKFNTAFKPLDENDVLGTALFRMQKKIIQADVQEQERKWIIEGIAEIGDILRSSNELKFLGLEVIKFMVSKIDAVQGAIYVLNENESHDLDRFDLISCYAYNRKKYINNGFFTGEGLAGQAAFEKDTVFRKEVPDEYFNITSGLITDKKPTSLVLVPLITNEKVYGVIEFGAIHVFQPSQVKFTEEVAPIIARTLFNILVNEKTSHLLKQSQQMSSELQSQQEVLKKNAEDMEIAQEELQKANNSLQVQMTEVKNSQKRMQLLLQNASEVITIYEEDTTIRYISPAVESILGYEAEELIGLKGKTHVNEEDYSVASKMFSDLINFPDQTATIQYQFQHKSGEYIWLEATGKNLLQDPAVKGIVINCRDITTRKRAEAEERMRRNMQALSENSPDLITRISSDRFIAYINPAIEQYAGVAPEFFMGKSLEEINETPAFRDLWSDILSKVVESKENIETEVTVNGQQGKRVMQVNAIAEYNEENLESVLIVSHDITERKLIELEIQEKNKKINESINYSQRIQNAIVPDSKFLNKYLPDSFIFYKPKDVVSGDFPWFLTNGEEIFVAAVDCTGHGVPGAMLSLVGCFLLNNVVESDWSASPAHILDEFDAKVNTTLNIENMENSIKDGMDIGLCKINLKKGTLEYAGAHRPLYYLSGGELTEYKGDKWAIGGGVYKNQTNFTNHALKLKKGDSVFVCSDGLPDQFGGPNNRKFGPRKIRDMITENSGKNMGQMHDLFEKEFYDWMGKGKQMDDVLLMGIRF